MTESIMELSSEILRSRVRTLIAEKNFKDNCMKISEEIKNTTNPEKTVLELEKYVTTYGEMREKWR